MNRYVKHAVVLALLAAACHTGSLQTSDEAGAASAVDVNAYPTRVNPITATGRVVVMGGAEGCHNVPADVDVSALMAAIDKSEAAGCELLADPVWATCRFGEVYAKA